MATVAIIPSTNVITGEIFIAAPPARVFQALTDPAQMPRWWGQSDMYRITEWKGDLRVGGKWSSVGTGSDGTQFRIHGEYLEVDPPRVLSHTWIASWTGDIKTIVRWELEPAEVHGLAPSGPRKAGTGTLVRMRHEGFPMDAPPQAAATSHADGWKRILGWLQAFTENNQAVDTRNSPSAN